METQNSKGLDYNKYNIGRAIIWFVILMLLSNASLLFESVILGNIIRTALVLIAYAVFLRTNAKVELMQANVTRKTQQVQVKDYKLGFKVAIPVLVIIVFAFLLEFLMSRAFGGVKLGSELTGSSVLTQSGSITAKIIAEYFMLAISAAVCEELAFRAVPMQCIKEKTTKLILATSVAFGLFHIANLITEGSFTGAGVAVGIAQAVGACGYGIVYAAIYYRCGSIIPAIMLHFINNMLAYLAGTVAVSGGVITYPSVSQIVITILSALIGAAFCAIYGMWMVKRENSKDI